MSEITREEAQRLLTDDKLLHDKILTLFEASSKAFSNNIDLLFRLKKFAMTDYMEAARQNLRKKTTQI